MIVFLVVLGVVILSFFIFYRFVFLRDPERKVPLGNNIVAPADGKVINIMEVKGNMQIKKGFFGRVNTFCSDIPDGHYLVSIFMSIFDVHVNRMPMEGRVIGTKHRNGRFFLAFDVKKSFFNESNEILLETKAGKIKVIQIAGFVARRIECFVRENQKINKGRRIGRIILGSQVSMILPKSIKLKVNVGDRVKAGESIIGEY